MSLRAVVTGCGHYLPARVVENAEFEATLDTNDEWIRSRSGIERRHFAAEGETTSTMASAAARKALEDAGRDVSDVDAIVVATSTPDLTFPSAATMVQAELGMTSGFAFAGLYIPAPPQQNDRPTPCERWCLSGFERHSGEIAWLRRCDRHLCCDQTRRAAVRKQIQ